MSNSARHSLVESPGRLPPLFLYCNLSGHQCECEVVKHSSIVVWTSTHMTLLRVDRLRGTGQGTVEALYSNILTATCLKDGGL